MFKTAINPTLSFGLNFDSHDLYTNQQGQMTTRQVRLLRDKRRQQMESSSWLKRMLGSLFYVLYGVTPRKHQWNLVGADITATVVDYQEGQVRLPKSSTQQDKGLPQMTYQIIINREQCKVNRRALRSFRHQDEYTVYYAPRSKHALSAETS